MSQTPATANTGQSALFRTGWVILLLAAALMTINHFGLLFYLDNPVLFIGWGSFNLYSLVVVAIPFRKQEKWAWYTTWILPICLAAGGFSDPDPNVSIFYYAFAAVCVVGLLLTMREFFAVDRQVSQRVS